MIVRLTACTAAILAGLSVSASAVTYQVAPMELYSLPSPTDDSFTFTTFDRGRLSSKNDGTIIGSFPINEAGQVCSFTVVYDNKQNAKFRARLLRKNLVDGETELSDLQAMARVVSAPNPDGVVRIETVDAVTKRRVDPKTTVLYVMVDLPDDGAAGLYGLSIDVRERCP